MEERDQILIDRYLAGELTEAERSQFEQRKKDDPFFREEVRQYDLAREAIRVDEDEEILKRFKKMDVTLDHKEDKGPSRKYWFLWLALTAILVLGVVGWKLNWLRPASPDTMSKVTIDTTEIDQKQYDISDTSKLPVIQEQEEKKIEPEKTREKETPAMVDIKKGKELFAEYFEPYKDDMMDPATRGQSDPTPFDKFRQAYWDGRYSEVQELFKNIPSSQQENDNYRFQLANALLHNEQTDSAIDFFEKIINNKKSRYQTEAYYGLGLGLLKKGDIPRARENLNLYIKDEKAVRKQQAKKLLQKL